MQTEEFKKEIGGKVWTLALLPTGKGINIGRRVLRIVGPALGSTVASMSNVSNVLDMDIAQFGTPLESLAERLGDEDTTALIKELVTTGVFCDGKEVTDTSYELLFQGDYATLLAVAAFVVEANYKIPLSSWLDAVAVAMAERATSEKQTEQDGEQSE